MNPPRAAADGAPDLRVLLMVRRGGVAEPLRSVLVDEAIAWAHALGASVRTAEDREGPGESDRFADVVSRALAKTDSEPPMAGAEPGRLLVVWPEIAALRPVHASAALDDLAAGADAVIGPIFGGGFYLLGVNVGGLGEAGAGAGLLPTRLREMPDRFWREPDALALAIPRPGEPPFELGLMRAERGLRDAADLFAARVDPVVHAPIAQISGDI